MNRKALITRLLRLGVRYGPMAYEGLMRNRGAIENLTKVPLGRSNSHRDMAFEHAAALIDGSVLPTFDGDTRVYVVFSGERPVSTHPQVRTPTERLLENYDLSKRITPEEWAAENAENQALSSGGAMRRRPGWAQQVSGPGGMTVPGRLLRKSDAPQDTLPGETGAPNRAVDDRTDDEPGSDAR